MSGETHRYQSGDEDNFSQPRIFWSKVLDEKEKTDLVNNLAGHMKDAQESIRARAVSVVFEFFGTNTPCTEAWLKSPDAHQ